MTELDVLIIGGGPAGLAAAIAAYEDGCRNILLLERESTLGGILKQCIHNGFGLHIFGKELTGPEYADRYIKKLLEYGIPYQCDTMVVELTEDKCVTAVSRACGLQQFRAKAIVLAMGCRERPRGALGIPGWRCAGIYTAGTAQKFVNMKGLMPGSKVFVLGSGDIGLIMARRMTFMGAQVVACAELQPYSAGLKRNIVQCLDDYDIPLLLSHTVVDVKGREHLEGVTVAEVDPMTLQPIPGTEQDYDCDTLLLSVGLIPENELSKMATVSLSDTTSGAVVDEQLETSVPGIFACGNVLHVHDLVDDVSKEAQRAGLNASRWARSGYEETAAPLVVEDGFGVAGAVPQLVHPDITEPVPLMFRPRNVYKNAKIHLEVGGQVKLTKRVKILTPGEMVSLSLKPEHLAGAVNGDRITLRVEVAK